jgi:spermidine synthase
VPLLLAVFALSAGVIGYEILLTRLFSITLWHHFAFMIISIALLGIGASGTFLSFARSRLEPLFPLAFACFAAAFGVSALACAALALRVPFNPLELVWDLKQQLYLLQLYLVLAFPFFCAGTCIALALSRFGDRISAIYRADLVGAGGGALAVVVALYLVPAQDSLRLIGGLGLAAAALGALHGTRARLPAAGLAIVAVVMPLLWPDGWIAPRPSPYKGLSLTLNVPDARVIAQRSSPLGWLAVVESPTIPLRHAPGLSLTASQEPPAQLGIFTDGDGLTAITRFDKDFGKLAFLDQQTAALPFHLLDRPRTLVLGAGGGADVLLALSHRARSVDAVEINPQVVELLRRDYADFAGRLFEAEGVAVHIAEARSFVEASDRHWDLIQVALLDSFSASAAGVLSLSESTLYTVEALDAYLGRLAPGGQLAITRWLKVPPRDSLKLWATAVEALTRRGVASPGDRLALVRSWNTVTLIVKNGALSEADIAAIRTFAEERAFDVAYVPGMRADEANRYNRFAEPYLYEGAAAVLGAGRETFLDDYKFHIRPATDDSPYYFRFFKWRLLPEVLTMTGRSGVALLEGGYLVLAATLVQAAVVSALLIVLPLHWLRRGLAVRPETLGRGRVIVYFFALGLGFLFIEIAFIQRFVLFLGHPVFAIAVVLAAFLLFAGLGSGASARLAARLGPPSGASAPPRPVLLQPITVAATGIVLVAGVYLALLPSLFHGLMPQAIAAKVLVSVLLIAPLAFCMGMPFPLGLARVSERAPALVPWAWAVNGCASVLSAVLASLLAIHFGFTVVVALAMALYALAAVAFRR